MDENVEKGVYAVNSYLNMEIDEQGMPMLSLSRMRWVDTFFSACSYYVRRIFKTKEEIDNEEYEIGRFTAFLSRLNLKIEFDPVTESPSVSLVLGDPIRYRDSGKRRHGHKPVLSSKRKKARRKLRKQCAACAVPEGYVACSVPEEKEPVVIKSKHGNITYNIYNLVININANVVTQLNTNPQQIVNVFEEPIRAEVEKQLGIRNNQKDEEKQA